MNINGNLALAFLVIIIDGFIFYLLHRALKTGEIGHRFWVYTRKESWIRFWFYWLGYLSAALTILVMAVNFLMNH